MPRRPRPASRRVATVALSKPAHQKSVVRESSRPEYDSSVRSQESEAEPSGSEDEDSDSVASEGITDDYEEGDLDAPRVAQWVDEEEVDALAGETSEDEGMVEEAPDDVHAMKSIQNDLSSLPFGTLRKAQQKLAQAQPASDSDYDSDDTDGSPPPVRLNRKENRDEEVPEAIRKPKERPKRSSKHAPTEVSSKRPVTRRRTVVEVKKVEARDPRFLPLAGEFDPSKFRQQYGFLSELHQTELKTLRDDLKRARKLLASSPRDFREERSREVDRLERAVKRAESAVNKDRREEVEHAALQRVKQEEKQKQKQGKGAWFMKPSRKKELLTKARYEALASSGGGLAVKKAIEKKQRKISQKEKKSRPFAPRRTDGETHRADNKRTGAPGSSEAQQRAKRQRTG
ncbi:DUF947-domain-containing protein [Gloeophyllum trabeum ATCC 11539]|uniref:rRNA biogenesis protein RRP36 n=1 Tax=Gloeophyllum trabeum (strain ATCC 11539 / FP-39264 / Madison 617) TaxID=670483 RepID=S7S476_GLOTA|nr:DUF947-domain-containing protein [Gloeophyllum trabeum ATCC 11539]EPQ60679.1 DUF947-domain-containing protein [Gloeophyllum trabeum ATCC 11539]